MRRSWTRHTPVRARTAVAPGVVVVVVMPLSFTAAWVLTARATDDSGLRAVGAVLVLLGTVGAAAVLVPLGAALRPRATGRRSA